MQDRHVILDDRRLADDQTGGMVDEDALADAGGRIDVGLEDGGGPALQVERKILAAFIVEPVGQPVRLDRMEPLEVEHRHQEAVAGRIAVVIGLDVDADDRAPFGIGLQHRMEALADDVGAEILMRRAARPDGG